MPANPSDKERILELEASLEECRSTITSLKKELEEERARVKDLTKDLNKERKQRLEAVLVQGPGSPMGGIPLLVPGGRPRAKTAPAVPTTVPDSLCLQEILDLVLRPINDVEGWCILHEVCSVLIELHSSNKIHGSVSMKSIRIDRSAKVWAVQDYLGVPELPKGEQATIRADIYCLGATVWSAADYLLDFDEETGLSPEICALIEKMTSEVPSERPTAEDIKLAAAQYAIQSRYIFNALLQEVDRKKNFRKDIDKEFAEKHKGMYSSVLTEILIGVKLKPVVARSDNKPKNVIDKKGHAELLLLRRSSSRLLKSRLSGNIPALISKERELAPKALKVESKADPNDKKGPTLVPIKETIGDANKDLRRDPIRDSANKEISRDPIRDSNKDMYKEKEASRETNRELTRDTRERVEERGREATKETRRSSKDSPKERDRDTKRESPRERERDTKRDSKESPRDTKKESRDSPRDNMYRESTFNTMKDVKDAIRETKRDSREITRDIPRETKRDSREITRDMYRDLNRDINREITRDANRGIASTNREIPNREIASPTRELTNRELASPIRDANREISRDPNREITRETTKYLNREDAKEEKSRRERHKEKSREKKEEKERKKESGEKRLHRHREKHKASVVMPDSPFFPSPSPSLLSPPFRSLSPPLSSSPLSSSPPLISVESPSTRAKRALSQPSPSRKI